MLTVIWLVGMMNVVNFSDGVDGLAAGVCTIDGVAFAVIAFDLDVNGAAILAALTAGRRSASCFTTSILPRCSWATPGPTCSGICWAWRPWSVRSRPTPCFALVVPLVVLAIPFLDTSFVIAKRLKYRRKPWAADANHFHHRMARIGFSQRKTVAYLYTWTLLMAGLAVALRLIGHHHKGQLGWMIALGALGALCLAASIYLVYVLEIFKFKGLRTIELRRSDPDTTEHEIDDQVQHDLETGEFDRIDADADARCRRRRRRRGWGWGWV